MACANRIFLNEKLLLKLNPQIKLRQLNEGVDFLGYIVRPDYILVRKRVIGNLYEKLLAWERSQIKGSIKRGWMIKLHRQPIESLQATLSSYLGHFKHTNAYRLIEKVFKRFSWLQLLFYFDAKSYCLLTLWKPNKNTIYYNQQIQHFRYYYPHALLEIQRGVELDYIRSQKIDDLENLPVRYAARKLVIREVGYLKSGLKKRVITTIFVYSGVQLCL